MIGREANKKLINSRYYFVETKLKKRLSNLIIEIVLICPVDRVVLIKVILPKII